MPPIIFCTGLLLEESKYLYQAFFAYPPEKVYSTV
jgi:hypothetical protein